MNKKFCLFALVASLVFLTSFCTNHKSAKSMEPDQSIKDSGFAVVELFTSEGCSSCPSADKAVEELQKQYPSTVYVLAFHVDYWNRLGWTDEFSKAEYTARQSNYARQFNLESIYTPQVVINGQYEFVGSEKTRLQSTVTGELKKQFTEAIELSATRKDDKTISVQYKWKDETDAELKIALVQKEATTDVKNGENGGRKLHHINLVRDYKTIDKQDGSIELSLPSSLKSNEFKIVAYLQKKDGKIIAVKQTGIAA